MKRRPDLSGFAHRLGGEFRGERIRCPGPGHSPKDRSLSVQFRPDGGFSVYSFAGDDWQTCMDHVRVAFGLPQFESRHERQVAAGRLPRNQRIEQASTQRRSALALRIWNEAVDPRGTLAETYLDRRGLILPATVAGRVIRFHPACPFDAAGVQPAMVAAYAPIINDSGGPPVALHRTALKPDGSGHVGKRMLGSVLGQCVKLSGDEEVTTGLHLAEGIETALALFNRGWRPIWAATTAGCIRTFPVLGGVECLTIGADHDSPGLEAAQVCAERYAGSGREAFIRWPSDFGQDYADEVRP